jgi:hypothetical protein
VNLYEMTPDERFAYLLERTAKLQDQVAVLWDFTKQSPAWKNLDPQARERIYKEHFEYQCRGWT